MHKKSFAQTIFCHSFKVPGFAQIFPCHCQKNFDFAQIFETWGVQLPTCPLAVPMHNLYRWHHNSRPI